MAQLCSDTAHAIKLPKSRVVPNEGVANSWEIITRAKFMSLQDEEEDRLIHREVVTQETIGSVNSQKLPKPFPFVVRRWRVGPGAWLLTVTPIFRRYPVKSMQALVFMLTFFSYTCYHMTRKAFSAVDSTLLGNCSTENSSNETFIYCDPNNTGWSPFNTSDDGSGKSYISYINTSWLFAYAISMFISGIVAERIDLRVFLTLGMIGNGVLVGMLGVAYFANIHSLAYFVIFQLLAGMLSATGWPAVVAVMGNWFGKRGRGLFMGIWNAHTSVGNILGVIIPGIWSDPGNPWGWSFVAPALIMITMGIIIFVFLVVDPRDIGLSPPHHHEDTNPFAFKKPKNSSANDSVRSYESTGNTPSDIPERSKQKADEDEEQKMMISGEGSDIEDDKTISTTPGFSGSYRLPSPPPESLHEKSSAIGFFSALRIPGVIEYSLALFFNKLVAYTFLFWLPLYIKNTTIQGQTFSSRDADWYSALFDVGGVVGSILTGLFSDLLNMRAVICIAMLYFSIPTLAMSLYLGKLHIAAFVILLLFSGLFVNGPYALITTAVSTDLSTHKDLKNSQRAKATVSAIIDGTGSIGAAIGPLLAGFLSNLGSNGSPSWQYMFFMMMGSELISSLFLTRLFIGEMKRVFHSRRARSVANYFSQRCL